VNREATAERRAAMDRARPAFSYGPLREAFDRDWPDELQTEVAALVLAAPPVFRQPLRLQLLDDLERHGVEGGLRERAADILAGLTPYTTKDA
jgi:hypothetical protein